MSSNNKKLQKTSTTSQNKRRKTRDGSNQSQGAFSKGFSSMTMGAATSWHLRPQPPVVRSDGKSTFIKHIEMIEESVLGSTTFAATKYYFNPGLPLYPWLSDRAHGWEKMLSKGLKVTPHYIPSKANTSTPGSVYIAIDYDPTDPSPTTLAKMSTYDLTSGRTYEHVCIPANHFEMTDGVNAFKIREGPVAGDLALYDPCSIIVGTTACTDTSEIGQLWIEYELELVSPQLDSDTKEPFGSSLFNLSAAQTFASTVIETVAFDEAIYDGLSILPAVDGEFILPKGRFLVTGEICAESTLGEALTCSLQVFLDGAVVSPPQLVAHRVGVTTSGPLLPIPFTFCVTSTGSSTLTLQLILTGAAGTLTAMVDRCRVLIQVL